MSATRNSLVAYFDILGYQSFLKSNSALESAENVFNLVKSAPKLAVEFWSDEKFSDEWKATTGTIRSLVFSDTIVVSCPVSDSGPTELQTVLIGGITQYISRKMFENGLPVRGAIALGSFIFNETCIAGQAVVDAHDLCQMLDVAGAAFSPDLSRLVEKNWPISRHQWDKNFPYFLLPLKEGREIRTHLAVNPFLNDTRDSTVIVREAFWKWDKDIPSSADKKVHNTAKMLDFLKMQAEQRALKK